MALNSDFAPVISGSGAFEPIIEIGTECVTGSYLLRIQVLQPQIVVFGRFLSGRPVDIPAGEYVYVGSAMGRPEQPALARRVVRHASRSGSLSPHYIRRLLLQHYQIRGWASTRILPRNGKNLFWHIDYLLDKLSAHVVQVYLIHAERRLESGLVNTLEQDGRTETVKRGLGARDHPGHSHLLSVRAPENWWSVLPQTLQSSPEVTQPDL